MKGKLISETAVTCAQVKDMLVVTKERDGELSYRAQKTLEYLEQNVSITSAQASKLLKSLQALAIPRLREQHLLKLIDVLPLTMKDVKVVLQAYSLTVSNENMQKIADAIIEATA